MPTQQINASASKIQASHGKSQPPVSPARKLSPKALAEHTRRCALAIAEQGGRVFPMRFIKDGASGKARKVPAIKGWPEKATGEHERIDRFFARPGLGIGIATEASGWVVFDTDQKPGIDGDANLRAWLGEHAHYLDETETIQTPSGSKHYRFMGDAVKSSGSVLAPGVDVKSRGGYVVGEGSVTPTGGVYRVIANGGIRLPLPQPIIALVANAYTAAAKPRTARDVPGDDPVDIASARSYLAEAQDIDGYNNAMNLARKLWDFGITTTTAIALFAEEINPRLPHYPWELDELEKKMPDWHDGCENAFGCDSVAGQFGDLDLDDADAERDAEALAEVRLLKDIDASDADILALIRKHAANGEKQMTEDATAAELDGGDDAFSKALAALISMANLEEKHAHTANLKPLIQGLVLRNTLITMIAPPKAGKTALACDIGACIATDRPWQGHKVAHGVYLHILCEGMGGAVNRAKALKLAANVPNDAPFYILPMAIDLSNPAKKASANLIIRVAKHLEKQHGLSVQIITIDTLSRAGAGDESTDALGKVIRQLDYIREKTGATVMGLHHTPISDPTRSRGGGVLTGAIDAEILLVDKKEIRFQNVKEFDEPSPIPYKLATSPTQWTDGNGDAIYAVTISYDADPAEEFDYLAGLETGRRQAIIAAIKAGHDRVYMGKGPRPNLWTGSHSGVAGTMSLADIDKALATMVEAGDIKRETQTAKGDEIQVYIVCH